MLLTWFKIIISIILRNVATCVIGGQDGWGGGSFAAHLVYEKRTCTSCIGLIECDLPSYSDALEIKQIF